MTPYCPHFHIDHGESQCWAVVDRMDKFMTLEQIQQYTRPTLCNGDERVCEFKKFGIRNLEKEKRNDE